MRLAELRPALGTAQAAVRVAAEEGVAVAAIKGWRARLKGVPRDEWPPALAPSHGGGPEPAMCDPRAWDFLRADYLRPARPAFSACHARLLAAAAQGRAPAPGERTLRRRLAREVAEARRMAG